MPHDTSQFTETLECGKKKTPDPFATLNADGWQAESNSATTDGTNTGC